MLPHLAPSPSSRRVSRRGFLAASAVAMPAAWAVGSSGVASAAPARRAEETSSAIGLEYIGATNSPRTAEQTEVANFWYPALNFAYVQITRAVLASTSYPLSWQVRFVAAFNVITTDAQISIYNAKYKYLFWRPYTAITTGDYLQDPTWTSFWAAPQHPEYPSGHGGQIGSQQGVLDALLGPRAPSP